MIIGDLQRKERHLSMHQTYLAISCQPHQLGSYMLTHYRFILTGTCWFHMDVDNYQYVLKLWFTNLNWTILKVCITLSVEYWTIFKLLTLLLQTIAYAKLSIGLWCVKETWDGK